MSAQLSLYGAGLDLPSVTRVDGDARSFVLCGIPTVGHRKGTAREGLMRPVAELYWRAGDTWHREMTARPAIEHPRSPERPVAQTHGDALFWLTLLRSDFAEVTDFADRITPGLEACGVKCRFGRRMKCALLPSLDALVIAMAWEPATEAGCFLASFVEPGTDEWRVYLDMAHAQGLPWSQRLAELSAMHGPLVRAWRWLWETRPRWSACGACKHSVCCDPDWHRRPGQIWTRRVYWLRSAS